MEKIPKNSIVYLTQNRETYDEIVRVLHSYSKIQCHRITDISGPELLSVLGIQSIPLNWDTFVSGSLSQLTEILVLTCMEMIWFQEKCPN